MILFHCHQFLSKASSRRLLALIQSTEDVVIVLLREQGTENLSIKNFVTSINQTAQLKVLKAALKTSLLIDAKSSDFEYIDQIEFVQLCSDAIKIIAWK